MIKPELSRSCDCGAPGCPGEVLVTCPFGIALDEVSGTLNDSEVHSDVQLHLTVRTSSWDYSGERTDLHDLFSLLWAAALRVFECR
jgi:hypothetical protein